MVTKRKLVNTIHVEMEDKLLARLVVETAANLKDHLSIGHEGIKDRHEMLKLLKLDEDCFDYSLRKIQNVLYKTVQAEAEFVFDFAPLIKKFLDTNQCRVISSSMWLTGEEIEDGYLNGKVQSNRNWQEMQDQFLSKKG